MAGHIAGLGYSQRMDVNGDPLAGCKLYIFETGTSTPATVYEDYSLSIEHTHPITADAAGIIPMFWVDDGTYRVRLTDASGNEIFDDDAIVALGPSSGTGGGSGATTPEAAIFTTGDMLWGPVSGTRTGWVRSNGRTVGSAASGGTERAAGDVEELFAFLWNGFSNSICAVSGGRGANAAADFAANKTIATLDMRDRAPFGLSDMGSTSTGQLGTTPGEADGFIDQDILIDNLPSVTFSHTLAAATHTHNVSGDTSTESAAHTHTGTTSTDGAHTHTYTDEGQGSVADRAGGGGTAVADDTTGNETTGSNGNHSHTMTTGNPSVTHTHPINFTSGASGSLAVTGTVSSGGSGAALGIMPPYRLGTWYMKL
jgi:hypothetical protein